jgi:carboxyl-terminal processing protease
VQKPYQFPDGSMLRLTVAHYYTPSGRCIQKPYKMGEDEEYDLDFSNRMKHGELTNPDSIHFLDTTQYFTNNKRLVRGGGGIMPDLFVPLDTTPFSGFYSDLLRKNSFNDYVLTYVDNNRSELKKTYAQLEDFKTGYVVTEKFYNDFLANAEKLGVKMDSTGMKTSQNLIKLQIKALIARELWNVEGYFEVINERNETLKKAIEAIHDNTFEKMKIAER